MLRKMTTISVLAAMLSAMSATMPARANNSIGVGVATFACNITIEFPRARTTNAKTNCNGDAYSAAAFVAGAKQGTGILAVGNLDKKDKFHNFLAYNVQYLEPCLEEDELVPLIGFAEGHAIIAGMSTTGAAKRIHTFFGWTRVGVVAVVSLFNTHSEFGGLNKFHKTDKDGTPLGKSNIFDGVGVVVFDPKPPVGSCVTPNPQQAINVVGLVATTGLLEFLLELTPVRWAL